MHNTSIKKKKCVNNLSVEKHICDLTPWQKAPYQLTSWWKMILFSAQKFYCMIRILERLRKDYCQATKDLTNTFILDTGERRQLEINLRPIEDLCVDLMLHNSMATISEFRNDLLAWKIEGHTNMTAEQIIARFDEIGRAIDREMKLHLFMYIPNERANCYKTYIRASMGEGQYLFGRDVMLKFTSMSCDIEEAGTCFAVARYTACVFHLMRVMEMAVQEFGGKLGVSLAIEKEWQTIIGNIRTELNNKFPKHKDPDRIKFESILAHLESVKIAWRNPTMHPKATYTQEEAKDIIHTVKIFMCDLVNII